MHTRTSTSSLHNIDGDLCKCVALSRKAIRTILNNFLWYATLRHWHATKVYVFTFALVISNVMAFGQSKVQESKVSHAITFTIGDTVLIDSLIDLTGRYQNTEPYKALDLAAEALTISRSLKDLRRELKIENEIAYVNRATLSDFAEALRHLQVAQELVQRIGDPVLQLDVLYELSQVYETLGDTAKELSALKESLSIAEVSRIPKHIGTHLRSLAGFYSRNDDQKNALDFYHKALQRMYAAADTAEAWWAMHELVLFHFKYDRYDSCKYYLDTNLALLEKYPISGFGTFAHVMYARVELKNGTAKRALKHAEQAMMIAKDETPFHRYYAYMVMGKVRSELMEPAKARQAYVSALALARSIKSPEFITDALEGLYRSEKKSGNMVAAVRYLEEYHQAMDSLKKVEGLQETAVLMARKEHQQERLADSLEQVVRTETQRIVYDSSMQRERDRREFLIACGTAGTVVFLLFAYLMLKRLQQTRKLANQEQELHTQRIDELMNTNELTAMNSMIEGQEKERDRVAKDLHDRLGSMLSAIKHQLGAVETDVQQVKKDQGMQYSKMHTMLDEAVGEVRRISHDMITVALSRFGLAKALEDLCDSVRIKGKLDVELQLFGLEQRMERSMEIAVYRIVQEAISNVLKHAKATELSVDVTRGPGRISVIVHDNGKGFDPAIPSTGIGMENMRNRAMAIGALLRVDSSLGNGTTISVEGPVVE